MTVQPHLVRPYRAEDKPSALQIWIDASIIAHPFFSEEQLLEQQKLVGDVYLEKAETWVAEIDGMPVGFIGLLDRWSRGTGIGHWPLTSGPCNVPQRRTGP